MNKPSHYKLLAGILAFYLIAQIFQQYVSRLGPMAGADDLQTMIVAGQHPLNYTRMVLILLSMFFMVPGFIILGRHFYGTSPLLSIVAIAFFLFFCLFETGYRSVQLFQVMMKWGTEYVQAAPEGREVLLPRIQSFYDTVNALYFPLLFSLLLGSLCIFAASFESKSDRLVSIAMGVQAIQQISRLSGYTPFSFLNIFTRFWYFIPVLIAFTLLIYWSIRKSRKPDSISAH